MLATATVSALRVWVQRKMKRRAGDSTRKKLTMLKAMASVIQRGTWTRGFVGVMGRSLHIDSWRAVTPLR